MTEIIIEKTTMSTRYYKNIDGKQLLHREDGPAVEWQSGDGEYYINGIRHRVGGPAIKYQNFSIWFENGIKHRLDGPAQSRFISYNKSVEHSYYYKGTIVDVKTDEDYFNFLKFKAFF